MLNREHALTLIKEYGSSASLLKHAFGVEACMNWYARYFQEKGMLDYDILTWSITGLLHDFDYERYPEPTSPNGHPFAGNAILEQRGYPAEVREAIMGHATYSGVPRTSLMAKTLFAVDELSGLVTAAVLVRPDKAIAQLTPHSVLKKMKDKAFARGCNRDDIRLGAEELQIPLEEHIANVIAALTEAQSLVFNLAA